MTAGSLGARLGSRAAPALVVAALSVAAWLTLALWAASPYARYVEHGGWADIGAVAALCRALPRGEIVVPAALHALAWLLMITAMMLPTALPLVTLFRRITAGRPDEPALVARLLAGYALAWFGFGVIAHALDAAIGLAAARSGWLALHGSYVAAGVLVGAGLFQFSALKYRCLEQCRTPFSFVTSRWGGRAPARDALRIGLDHGVFCVGCCWALMLVMFVVGIGSIGWMLALAAVMAAEKNLPWGRQLRTPVGVGLIAWGVVLAVAA